MDAEGSFEIAVVGGGMVGAATVRALAGARIALVAEQRPATPATGRFDARIYAISPGNAGFLAQLGAWSAIDPQHLTPVHAMRVYGDDGASMVSFDAYRSGVGELAWIVEDGRVQDALWRGLQNQERLSLYSPASLEGIEVREQQAELSLRDGRKLSAALVVGADGASSFVRSQAGITGAAVDYGQTAVVANFACSRPHRNVAYQWFLGAAKGGAVLALLPLPGDHLSIVWSTTTDDASRLLALAPDGLAREVALASHEVLGELSLVSPPRGFPLRRLAADRMVAPRVALAGDAAHVVHPLAGQGANLGLQDARALAAIVAARAPGRDPGELRLLRRYERARAEAILAMRSTVHGLFRLFDAPGPAAAGLRNAGLKIAERLPAVKNLLMRHAME